MILNSEGERVKKLYVVTSAARLVGIWEREEDAEYHQWFIENNSTSKNVHIHEVDIMGLRSCSYCQQKFPSWGPGNKRCDPCQQKFTANNGVFYD